MEILWSTNLSIRKYRGLLSEWKHSKRLIIIIHLSLSSLIKVNAFKCNLHLIALSFHFSERTQVMQLDNSLPMTFSITADHCDQWRSIGKVEDFFFFLKMPLVDRNWWYFSRWPFMDKPQGPRIIMLTRYSMEVVKRSKPKLKWISC